MSKLIQIAAFILGTLFIAFLVWRFGVEVDVFDEFNPTG